MAYKISKIMKRLNKRNAVHFSTRPIKDDHDALALAQSENPSYDNRFHLEVIKHVNKLEFPEENYAATAWFAGMDLFIWFTVDWVKSNFSKYLQRYQDAATLATVIHEHIFQGKFKYLMIDDDRFPGMVDTQGYDFAYVARTNESAKRWVIKYGCPDELYLDCYLKFNQTTYAFIEWFQNEFADRSIPEDFYSNCHSASITDTHKINTMMRQWVQSKRSKA